MEEMISPERSLLEIIDFVTNIIVARLADLYCLLGNATDDLVAMTTKPRCLNFN